MEYLDVICFQCGKEFKRYANYAKARIHNFCSMNCRDAFYQRFNYRPNRQGQRRARKIVSKHFNLESSYVVHHKDGNALNNDIRNLAVFRSNNEHISHHKGGYAKSIWDGELVNKSPDPKFYDQKAL